NRKREKSARMSEEGLLSTRKAMDYLAVSEKTLGNYQQAKRLNPLYDAEGGRVWKRSELDALRASWPNGKKPAGRPPRKQQPAAEAFERALALVTKGQTPQEIFESLDLPPTASMRQVTAALQRRIAQLIIEHGAIEVLTAGLYSPDSKTR